MIDVGTKVRVQLKTGRVVSMNNPRATVKFDDGSVADVSLKDMIGSRCFYT